jgi:hypothetical protein
VRHQRPPINKAAKTTAANHRTGPKKNEKQQHKTKAQCSKNSTKTGSSTTSETPKLALKTTFGVPTPFVKKGKE